MGGQTTTADGIFSKGTKDFLSPSAYNYVSSQIFPTCTRPSMNSIHIFLDVLPLK